MDAQPTARRVIEVNRTVIGPVEPKPSTVRPRKLSDYPQIPQVYREVAARLSSPMLLGPPICDELMAFVQHLFTEEEAGVVRHLGIVSGRSAAAVAKREHRPLDQVAAILRRLAEEKYVIAASGPEGDRRYRLMPLMPGVFEMVLIGQSPESMSPWHRRFAELFEALYETGFSAEYQQGRPPTFVRYLPVGKAIEAGVVKQLPLQDVLAVKREAEERGMVNWMMNVQSEKGQCSCSCCGCCCKAMSMEPVPDYKLPYRSWFSLISSVAPSVLRTTWRVWRSRG
jgi:hypothetical protein